MHQRSSSNYFVKSSLHHEIIFRSYFVIHHILNSTLYFCVKYSGQWYICLQRKDLFWQYLTWPLSLVYQSHFDIFIHSMILSEYSSLLFTTLLSPVTEENAIIYLSIWLIIYYKIFGGIILFCFGILTVGIWSTTAQRWLQTVDCGVFAKLS